MNFFRTTFKITSRVYLYVHFFLSLSVVRDSFVSQRNVALPVRQTRALLHSADPLPVLLVGEGDVQMRPPGDAVDARGI